MTRKLTNALLAQKRKTQATVLEIYGTLGIPIGGTRAVEVSGRNSYVYVKLRDNPNEVIQAFNNKVAPSYNLPVVVLREGNRYIVARVNSERYENNWNNSAPYLPAHGSSHSFPDGGGADVTWMFSRQFMPFLAFPSTYSGTVTISPHVISDPSGNWMYVGNTGTASLLGYMPSGSDQSIMALIYMDSRTGNPGYLIGSGTPFSNNVTGTQDIYRHVPPLSSPYTQIPIVAVRINTGTTGVGWDNLYDMRQWLHATPSGTSSGGGTSIDTIGFAGLSNGSPLGTGTMLNVRGNATFSRSGTMFDLFLPAAYTDAQAQAAIGTILVDSSTIDLVYTSGPPSNEITAHLRSGTVSDVHVNWGTGTFQVNALDIPIFDNGNFYTGTTVEAALQQIGIFSTGTSHNTLLNLQGGTGTGIGQYYHLTSGQHNNLTGGGTTTLHTHSYNDLGDKPVTKVTASLADDTATSFTPATNPGALQIFAGNTTVYGFFRFNTSTPAMLLYTGGSNINNTTGVLNGTTGVDGKVTVSSFTDGKIYIENRIGATLSVTALIL